MSFDQEAVAQLFSDISSVAEALGIFSTVNTHEPVSAPGDGFRLAIHMEAIEPLPAASGLSSTTGYVVFNARIYGNLLQSPEDDLDPNIAYAMIQLIGAYSGDFTLGGTVRDIDMLGEFDRALEAKAGYAIIGDSTYRVMDLTIPVVVNDLWDQVA